MSLSLDDIAKLAGVSRATASRVINNHPDVSAATRQKVQEVIAAHNFRPHRAAQMLATQRTRIIGIAVRNPSLTFKSDYGTILFEGINEIATGRDYAMLLHWEQQNAEDDHFSQRVLEQNRLMDGMLLASTLIASPLIDHLVALKIPFVMMERPTRHEAQISYVTVDNVQGAYDAVAHLIQQGRRRIAHVAGLKSAIDAQDRVTGYRKALDQHGFPFDADLYIEGAWSREGGYSAMKTLLERNVPIDAVFVAHDSGAEGALGALQEAGLRVPDDVALVGFDNLPNVQRCVPPLTTVHQPIREKGARATALLLDMIEGTVKDAQHIILPTQLIVRQSTGG